MKVIILTAILALTYAQDPSCKDEYNKCRNEAFSKKDFPGIARCGIKLAKCKGVPLKDCLTGCYTTVRDCSKIFTGVFEKIQCLVDAGKCAYECKKYITDDEVMADEINDEKSCSDIYNECRTGGSSVTDCLKSYAKCRGEPAVKCLKTCHANVLDCRANASGYVEKLQCYLSFVKCTSQCGLAPHNDEIIDDVMEDFPSDIVEDEADQTCSDVYNQCRSSAEKSGILSSIIKCSKDYLICRGTPAVTCALTCAFTLKECRKTASITEKLTKCWPQFLKCGVQCRPGSHNY